MPNMNRKAVRWKTCLTLAASAMLVAVGCISLQSASTPAPSKFWTDFQPQKLQAQYAASLEPNDGVGIERGGGLTARLWFTGVRQNELHMAEILTSLESDFVEMVKANGAEICGEVHETKSRRFLKKFEFTYRQGKITGQVWGEVKRGQKELSWDLECQVQEK
jgi:hypothetical protein